MLANAVFVSTLLLPIKITAIDRTQIWSHLMRLPERVKRVLRSGADIADDAAWELQQDVTQLVTVRGAYLAEGVTLAGHALWLAVTRPVALLAAALAWARHTLWLSVTRPVALLAAALAWAGHAPWVGIPFRYLVKPATMIVRFLRLSVPTPFANQVGQKVGAPLDNRRDPS